MPSGMSPPGITIDTRAPEMPGDLDADFGIISAMPFRNTSQGHAVAVQADGKILVAGEGSGWEFSDFVVTRYNVDGSFDSSFGYQGRVVTALSNSSDRARAIAIQSDGRIVVAGTVYTGSGQDFGVVRYLPNGDLDQSFGTNGLATVDYGETACANALSIQADGKIVLAGDAYGTLAMARLWPDGTRMALSALAVSRRSPSVLTMTRHMALRRTRPDACSFPARSTPSSR